VVFWLNSKKHMATQEKLDSKVVVDWIEKVSDEQCRR
jgi:hypothetical protein